MQLMCVGLFIIGGADLQTLFQPAHCILKEHSLVKQGPGPVNASQDSGHTCFPDTKMNIALGSSQNENLNITPSSFKMSVDAFFERPFF